MQTLHTIGYDKLKEALPKVPEAYNQFLSVAECMLARFRLQIEVEAETSIDEVEVNAGLFLYDLCEFMQLNSSQELYNVLGARGATWVDLIVDLPTSEIMRQVA